jgi:hypothetical protein
MKTKGGSARSGDVISYIFCLGDDGQTARTAQADKAHHPDDLRKAGSTLKIGEGLINFTERSSWLTGELSPKTMSCILLSKCCHQSSGFVIPSKGQIGLD